MTRNKRKAKAKKDSAINWWLEFGFWFFLAAAFFNLTLLPSLDLPGMLGAATISLLLVGVFFYLGIWRLERSQKKKSLKFWLSLMGILLIVLFYMTGIGFAFIYQFMHVGNITVHDIEKVFNSTNITNGSVFYANGYSFKSPVGYYYIKDASVTLPVYGTGTARVDYIFGRADESEVIMVYSFPVYEYGSSCEKAGKNIVYSYKKGMDKGISELGGYNSYSARLEELGPVSDQYISNAYEVIFTVNGTDISSGMFVYFCDDDKNRIVVFNVIGIPTEESVNEFYSMINSFRFTD